MVNRSQVPLGYKLIEVDSNITDASGRIIKKKKFIIDEETAPVVEKIFEMFTKSNKKMIESRRK